MASQAVAPRRTKALQEKCFVENYARFCPPFHASRVLQAESSVLGVLRKVQLFPSLVSCNDDVT